MQSLSRTRLRAVCSKLSLIALFLLSLIAPILTSVNAQVPETCGSEPTAGINVTTYHNDSSRTGWNSREFTLKACNVSARSFGPLNSVRLNDQVDAQPLVVSNQEISTQGGKRRYDVVVYVATASNTIYAIDGSTGAILKERTLADPVPQSKLPGQCGNNGSNVGITGTPVINPATGTIYLVSYQLEDDKPTYRIYALDLADLADKVLNGKVLLPQLIHASRELSDGSKYEFNASVSRQRPGLLAANGNIYVGFGSFCDFSADVSRGWLLGWKEDTLQPIAANELNDRRTATNGMSDQNTLKSFFLSSIWMSGYGIAADERSRPSDLFFISGNSDPLGPYRIDKEINVQESVVRMPADLSKVSDYFTPSGAQYGLAHLERSDDDFGSGGVLLVPDDPAGKGKRLAIAAGKAGQMYLLDRDDLGKYDAGGSNNVLDTVSIGRCWCGQSYFVGSDGVARIVSSGGGNVIVWRIENPQLKLAKEYTSIDMSSPSFQKGFFTSISSGELAPGTSIIWAIRRPLSNNPPNLALYAFNARDGTLLYSAPAGTWPNFQAAAPNTVPVVADGKVFVASYQELRIFGLGGNAATSTSQVFTTTSAKANSPDLTAAKNKTSGSVVDVIGTQVWLHTQGGVVQVDATKAQKDGLSVHLEPGQVVTVTGSKNDKGGIDAKSIYYGLTE